MLYAGNARLGYAALSFLTCAGLLVSTEKGCFACFLICCASFSAEMSRLKNAIACLQKVSKGLLPLALLHVWHAVTRFVASFVPPFEQGLIWSKVSRISLHVSMSRMQYAHA